MKIKNRLYMSAEISIILVAILVSLVLVTSGRIVEEDRKHLLLTNVRGGIAELDIVTYDYLLHREKRMEQQWNSKFNSLREILEKGAKEEALIPLYDDYVALGNLFSQITTNDNRIQKLIREGASQEKIDSATGLGERLVAQLLIASQSIVTDASRLAEEAHTEVTEAQRLAANLTLILMTILAITVTTLSLLVARSISKPLDELTKGAEIIGKGDLKHKVGVKSKDELGELAAAFNKMTANLREITASRDELNREITERKQAEEELRESEKKYRRLVESLERDYIIYSHDMQGVFTYLSPSIVNVLGYTQDEFMGHYTEYMTDSPINKDVERYTNAGLRGEKQLPYEAEFWHKDGSRRHLEVTEVPVYDNKGNVQGIEGIVHDITERKRAEEELKRYSQKLQALIDNITKAIALTTAMRDPYTSGHQQRVTQLACAIAEEMDLSKEVLAEIRVAGSLHDIGKMYIPSEILTKPGRLTDTEFDMIKTHSKVGYDILKTIDFPWPIAPIVLQHHERADGSGYPSGISAKDVLLEARILAVADVVEAMASHRPYRPAHGIDKALEEISQNRDILYDPEVVDACLRLFKEKVFKFE
jgi:PAS domain S-box-containing protein/putative nucleotidyltransferase with HDIG domain